MSELQQEIGHFPFVVGDATDDHILVAAGVPKAGGLIACLTNDRDNLFLTLTARSMNPKMRIVSKGEDDQVRPKMAKAGADSVVSPNMIGGLRLVSEMVRPVVVTFLDSMMREREKAYRFDEITIREGSSLAGQTLAKLKLRSRGDLLVVAVKAPEATSFVYNPTAETLIEVSTTLVLLGRVEDLAALDEVAQGTVT